MFLIQLEVEVVVIADGLHIYFDTFSAAAAVNVDKLVAAVAASAALVYGIFAAVVVAAVVVVAFAVDVEHEP